MGGENAQGNGTGFPCWLIYFEFFSTKDDPAFKHAEKKVFEMFGAGTYKVPKRMYLLFKADGGTEMQERALASRFSSKESAEGRLVYLVAQDPESIGRVGVERWDGK